MDNIPNIANVTNVIQGNITHNQSKSLYMNTPHNQ